MQTILITGAAGFIDSHLTDRLLAEGHTVVDLDNFDDFYNPHIKWRNLEPALEHEAFTLVEGDIRDEDLLQKLFQRYDIGKVVHLAARAGVRPSIEQPLLYEDVNARGTLTLLEACKDKGLEPFVYVSSSSVYGLNSKVPFREDDPITAPISPYAATKRSGELLCHTYHHLYEMPITCLRFFTVYGPRQRPDLAIHKFTRLIHAGEPIPMYGDGSSRRDYTFIDDILQGVVAALNQPIGYEIINLGESRTVELRTLIETLEDTLGRRAHIQQLPEQPGDVPVTYADISKAQQLLGYRPGTAIEEGIQEFTEWYLR